MQRETTILPLQNDPSQEAAPQLPGLEFRTARKARRARKEADARGLEQAREYLGTTAPRSLTPQAVYHWDREDQITALVAARQGEPDLGFMMRLLALCTLPRTNPGTRQQYRRVNGPFTLVMTATGTAKLPYGALPRLLLAWTCTEAVRTQSRTLILGSSLSEFMRKLGLNPGSGGRSGGRTRLQNQIDRLFRSTVELSHRDEAGERFIASRIADRGEFWWNPRHDHPMLWNSTIRLGEDFFNEIIACPVPLDMHILKAMKRSPLGLDLYLWLTYRTFGLKSPLQLSWRQLYRQFGTSDKRDKNTVKYFRKDVLRELRKLRTAWPELSYRLPAGFLELQPTPPRISEKGTAAAT